MTYFITIAGRRWPVEVGHRCYRSSEIRFSRLLLLSAFLRFSRSGLRWCPARAGVVAGRAVPALAKLAQLFLAGDDDPVPASGRAAGGDPAAVDPVVDAGGGHAEFGGQSRDGPFARVQVREDGGAALRAVPDGVLVDDIADLLPGEDRGALGRPVSRGVERAGDLPAAASLAGEPGDGLQEGRVVGELVQAADRADGSPLDREPNPPAVDFGSCQVRWRGLSCGGYRMSRDRRALTVCNEAPVWQSTTGARSPGNSLPTDR